MRAFLVTAVILHQLTSPVFAEVYLFSYRCNSHVCPTGHVLKANAIDLKCNGTTQASIDADRKGECRAGVDDTTCCDPKAKCSSHTCPATHVLKADAENLHCAGPTCNNEPKCPGSSYFWRFKDANGNFGPAASGAAVAGWTEAQNLTDACYYKADNDTYYKGDCWQTKYCSGDGSALGKGLNGEITDKNNPTNVYLWRWRGEHGKYGKNASETPYPGWLSKDESQSKSSSCYFDPEQKAYGGPCWNGPEKTCVWGEAAGCVAAIPSDDGVCCDAKAACSTHTCPSGTHVLKADSANIMCAGASCAASDNGACCDEKAACSTHTCPSATHVLKANSTNIMCAGAACAASDNGACCDAKARAACSTHTCPSDTHVPKANSTNIMCAGASCAASDNGACCDTKSVLSGATGVDVLHMAGIALVLVASAAAL